MYSNKELSGKLCCRYAQGKFETAFGVKPETSLEELSTSLTHTRAWLALVSGQVPQLAQHLQPLTDFAADQNRIQAAANAATTSAGKFHSMKVCMLCDPKSWYMSGFQLPSSLY